MIRCKKNVIVKGIIVIYGLLLSLSVFALDDASIQLRKAITNGDLKQVQQLLDQGIDVNKKIGYKGAPIVIAVKERKPEIVRFLIEKGADINVKSGYRKNSLMHEAVDKNCRDIVKILQKQGMSLDVLNRYKQTPLYIAVRSRNRRMVILLLESGAVYHKTDTSSNNPFKMAVKMMDTDIITVFFKYGTSCKQYPGIISDAVRNIKGEDPHKLVALLIKNGADPIAVNKAKQTPLHEAISRNYTKTALLLMKYMDKSDNRAFDIAVRNGNKEMVSALVQNGADIHFRDMSNNNALHMSLLGFNRTPYPFIRYLVKAGVSVTEKNNYGQTPLHLACKNSSAITCNYLLEQGADINAVDLKGNTALHNAVGRRSALISKVLMKHKGLDPDIMNKKHETPLLMAISNRQFKIALKLLTFKVNINNKNDVGNTALHLAVQKKNKDLVNTILQLKPDLNIRNSYGETPFMTALKHYDYHSADLLLEQGADVTVKTDKNETALHLAAKTYSTPFLKKLLNRGLDVNAVTLKEARGETPLHIAAGVSLTHVQLLVERKAHVNALNELKQTPLLLSAQHGKITIVKYLAGQGADVSVTDSDGNGLLHHAVLSRKLAVVKFVLGLRIKKDLVNKMGKTPFDLARKEGIRELLKEHGLGPNSPDTMKKEKGGK